MTRSQFIEMSQTMDSKVLRENQSVSLDGDLGKILNHQDSMETTIAMLGNNQFSVDKFTNVYDYSSQQQSLNQTLKSVVNQAPLRRSLN